MLEINNTTNEKISEKKLRLIADEFTRAYRKKGARALNDVSLAIVGASRMKTLNRDYRGLDKPTDVLSFTEENEIVINISDTKKLGKYREMFSELGVDIMNIKTASSEMQKKKASEYLFYFLFVHGLLHLVGYDDKTEAGRVEMIKKGRDFLNALGML